VALALCEMAHIVGKDYTMSKILPILTELMKDDNAEVRLNVVQNLIKLADIVQTDLLSPNFLTILQNITKDAQWRVRMGVIELVGDLSIKFGRDVFIKCLEVIFMQYLTNTAAAVREMGIAKVKQMAVQFKSDWVISSFVPKIVDCYNQDKQGFNYRMACLMSLSSVMNCLQKD
jgi:serine/threonine-protein phosphatase 2A regulatory subunit A